MLYRVIDQKPDRMEKVMDQDTVVFIDGLI